MAIVTIRGQLGSGVAEIGKEAARLLESEYVDKEVIQGIAKEVGQPVTSVAATERAASKLDERIAAALEGALARSGTIESAFSRTWKEPLDEDKYLDALTSVIEGLALELNIVIRGRGSQFILRNNPAALHVLVVAPLPTRIQRIMAESGMNESDARKAIEEYDASRRAFIKRFFKKEVEDPEHYDLIINTEHMAYNIAADVIVKAVKKRSPWERL